MGSVEKKGKRNRSKVAHLSWFRKKNGEKNPHPNSRDLMKAGGI